MRYFSVCVEETLGKGIKELAEEEEFDSVVAASEQMNEQVNALLGTTPVFEQHGKIASVIKTGLGYKAFIMYRGDFTGKKRRESQHMIQDALYGTPE